MSWATSHGAKALQRASARAIAKGAPIVVERPTLECLTERRDRAESALRDLGKRLDAYPRGAMGMTLESAKDDAWRALKAQRDSAFEAMRQANADMARLYPNALKAESLLRKIRKLDAVHWSQPSDSLALQIDAMESEYERMTGKACPAWPRRGA